MKIVNGFKPLNIFAKNSVFNVRQGSEYAFDAIARNAKISFREN